MFNFFATTNLLQVSGYDERSKFEERISKLEEMVEALMTKLDESSSNQVTHSPHPT